MDERARQLSHNLESVVKAVAEWTINHHAELDSTLSSRYGSGWRRKWSGDIQMRVRALAQAIAVSCPGLFTLDLEWALTLFASRGVPTDDLRLSVNSLREVLAGELQASLGDDPVTCLDEAVAPLEARNWTARPQAEPEPVQLNDVAAAYLRGILANDTMAAREAVLDAARGGMSVESIYETVLRPVQREVGLQWHAGALGIATEHLATATTVSVMAQLRPFFPQVEDTGRRMACATSEGELHEVGARMVADVFEMHGWTTVYVGPNLPTEDAIGILQETEVELFAISAATSMVMRSMAEQIAAVRANPAVRNLQIIVGGPPFQLVPNLWRAIGADGWASSAGDAVRVATGLLDGVSTDQPGG